MGFYGHLERKMLFILTDNNEKLIDLSSGTFKLLIFDKS